VNNFFFGILSEKIISQGNALVNEKGARVPIIPCAGAKDFLIAKMAIQKNRAR